MRPEAQAWWKLSQDDLMTADVNLCPDRYYACAFFCQQSVEKALKAVWMERKRQHAPKTHNLFELADDLGIAEDFDTALRRLNPEYVATRYPDAANGDPVENYNREIAGELLGFAQEIQAWCKSQLDEN